MYEGIHVKEFRVTGNLNGANTRMTILTQMNIFIQITDPLKCCLNWKLRQDVNFSMFDKQVYKITVFTIMFTSLVEIREKIEEYEQKQSDLENTDV